MLSRSLPCSPLLSFGSFRSSFLVTALAAAGLGTTPATAQEPVRTVRFAVQEQLPAPDLRLQVAADRVLVKLAFAVTPQQADAVLQPLGARFVERGHGDAFDVWQVPAGSVPAWVEWLSRQPGVIYAEPDPIAWTTADPNDPFFKPYQWNFFDRGVTSAGAVSNFGVQGQSAWGTSTGANVVVAIVDTGVAVGSDLAGVTFVHPRDFVNNDSDPTDDNGHGTHVCGTVAQATNNGIGVAGLAHGAAIMPIKVLNASGSGSHAAIASGIRWAADNGAHVINLSLGGSVGSTTLSSAVSYAWGKGVVLCAAAGNTGRQGVQYPARYTQCIAVGATRFDGARARYSTYGSGIDVVAPGGDLNVDQNKDGYPDGILQQTFGSSGWAYYFFQGTSMAAPHVAAIAALVKSNKPGYGNAQVRSAIESSCRDLGKKGYDTTYGYGLVDAAAALTK